MYFTIPYISFGDLSFRNFLTLSGIIFNNNDIYMEELDYNDLELDQLQIELHRLERLSNDYHNEEQAIKLTLNSIYGACGNNYFALFNPDVAESVTLQGRDIWKFAEKIVNRYFNEIWHKDTELHEQMEVSNVRQLNHDLIIYGDTDSVIGNTNILIQNILGEENEVKIEDLFNGFSGVSDVYIDEKGNQIIEPNKISALNYKKDNYIFSPIKKIIRHKVRKQKWKIITESGREVIVTNDHSITVFRNDKKIHIKPSEINIETDRVLSVYTNI